MLLEMDQQAWHMLQIYQVLHSYFSLADFIVLTTNFFYIVRSLLVISDDLPLSPRHEQAKLLLERARLKARSNHYKGDRPRRSHSDQRSTV